MQFSDAFNPKLVLNVVPQANQGISSFYIIAVYAVLSTPSKTLCFLVIFLKNKRIVHSDKCHKHDRLHNSN